MNRYQPRISSASVVRVCQFGLENSTPVAHFRLLSAYGEAWYPVSLGRRRSSVQIALGRPFTDFNEFNSVTPTMTLR